MNFETLFIIVIFLSLLFYYIMTHNCRHFKNEMFSQLKNIVVKNNSGNRVNHKKVEGFQNQISDNNLITDNKGVLMLFYSKTCPNCMDLIPIWEKLKKMKTSSIKFKSIEGDNDDEDAFIKYNIKYLPTIILQFEGKKDFNVYRGDRSIEDIIQFVRLNGINLNTTSLEGFLNYESKGYMCDYTPGSVFEKGKFKLNGDKLILTIKNHVYEYTIPDNVDTGKINPVYIYSAVSNFIKELRDQGKNEDEIAYELNKCNIKKFLKNLEYGLCYNNSIDKLKTFHKDSKSDLININLIDKKGCSNDNYIIEKQYDHSANYVD